MTIADLIGYWYIWEWRVQATIAFACLLLFVSALAFGGVRNCLRTGAASIVAFIVGLLLGCWYTAHTWISRPEKVKEEEKDDGTGEETDR